jgi:hypothetical protein
MNFFPVRLRDRWLLLLLPFKVYVFIAPVCYLLWELVTSGQRVRGAREEAFGIVAGGYLCCFMAFMVAVVLCVVLGKMDVSASASVLSLLSLALPRLLLLNAGILVLVELACVLAAKFARNRYLARSSPHQYSDPIDCPVCGTSISGSMQKCPQCAWTYMGTKRI